MFKNLRKSIAAVMDPAELVYIIVIVFLIAVFGAAFANVLNTQVTRWAANLTGNNAAAGTVVSLVPLVFWIIVAAALILSFVALIRHERQGSL
jgi:hypothetical protein